MVYQQDWAWWTRKLLEPWALVVAGPCNCLLHTTMALATLVNCLVVSLSSNWSALIFWAYLVSSSTNWATTATFQLLQLRWVQNISLMSLTLQIKRQSTKMRQQTKLKLWKIKQGWSSLYTLDQTAMTKQYLNYLNLMNLSEITSLVLNLSAETKTRKTKRVASPKERLTMRQSPRRPSNNGSLSACQSSETKTPYTPWNLWDFLLLTTLDTWYDKQQLSKLLTYNVQLTFFFWWHDFEVFSTPFRNIVLIT